MKKLIATALVLVATVSHSTQAQTLEQYKCQYALDTSETLLQKYKDVRAEYGLGHKYTIIAGNSVRKAMVRVQSACKKGE